MKKNIKLLIVIVILGIAAFIMYKFAFSKKSTYQKDYMAEVQKYVRDIYGTTFLIPEFDDINEAEEKWLWENVNQYVWNHDDEYHDLNEQEYGYTYSDVSRIVKTLYGDNLKKHFPKGAVSMRYNSYRELYGPSAYGIPYYYDYRIEKIDRDGNTFTVSLYDYTVSLEKFYGEDSTDDCFEIFNNYDYLLDGDNANLIVSVPTLNDEQFKNLLDKKDQLSHKILTIEYNEADSLFYIKSCKYMETKASEILATIYNKMQATFEIDSIEYNQDDIYTKAEIPIKNFDELIAIYTDNAVQTYKDEMTLFVYKDNGDVCITAGDITVGEYIAKIEFKDIQESEDKITATAVRTFRESFNSLDESYNKTYQKEDKFTIVKIDDEWFVDEFSYNKEMTP